MKKSEIKVGSTYLARVSGQIVPVRVDGIEDRLSWSPTMRDYIEYRCTNLKTTRRITFRSARKFRSEVKPTEEKRPSEGRLIYPKETHVSTEYWVGNTDEPLSDSLHPEGF